MAIPGVRIYGATALVPHHALDLTFNALPTMGVQVLSAEWAYGQNPMETQCDWEGVLRANGEVREFVMDGFLTEYQTAALSFSGEKEGVHFWHPTGAGKTLTGILWALLHPGNVIVITRAASRLQYGREIERYTHVRPYVLRPSSTLKKGAQPLAGTLIKAEC